MKIDRRRLKSRESVEKFKATMRAKYGNKYSEHFREIGRKGGLVITDKPRGFGRDLAKAAEWGKIGGRISRQNKKFLGESNGVRKYLDKLTGKVVEYKI